MEKDSLTKKWDELPERFQTLQQMYGRNEEGCGATVGMMPRCDFACKGCYLVEEANHIPANSLDDIKAQLRLLRGYLGKWGNLQLTDGEITLRDEKELIEILNYAHEIELIPMIMTHGDHFRRNPEFLYRLVRSTNLREVSFHIDTTQRGRYGKDYKYAKTEAELMPLREEFAALVRSVKKETSITLRAASTVTVNSQNLSEVSNVVSWFAENSDAFRLISFLPMAQVGRTEPGIADLNYESVWKEIEKGLSPMNPSKRQYSEKTQWWMGHPECNKFLFGFVLKRPGENTVYRRMSMAENEIDHKFLDEIYSRWPGLTFRADSSLQKLVRFFKMFLKAPSFFLFSMPRFILELLKDYKISSIPKLLYQLTTAQIQFSRLTVVTHHFMSKEEIETPAGQERLEYCSFKVPFNGELVSMCEFNALGKRSEYYNQLKTDRKHAINE